MKYLILCLVFVANSVLAASCIAPDGGVFTYTTAPPIVPTPVVPSPAPVPVTCGASTVIPSLAAAAGLNYRMTTSRNETRTIQITTPDAGRVGQFMWAIDTIGAETTKFVNVSTTPCDFSYTNFDAHNGCAASSQGVMIYYNITNSPKATGQICNMLPNTTYYLNVRNEMADTTSRSGNRRGIDTCPSGATCGYLFQLH